MRNRPDFIKHCEELRTDDTFTYPGDKETFGTGARLSRMLGLKKIGINYEVLKPGDRSSWPHAHKEEEEFILILDGNKECEENGWFWDNHPKHEQGSHDGWSDKKRPV